MKDFSMELIWAKIQMAAAMIGGWLGYFLGGLDGLMIALIIFMALDYITGLMCAVIDKKLSSAVGFRGICKKVLILMLVGAANVVDVHVVGTGSALRGAVRIAFYLQRGPVAAGKRGAHRSAHSRQDEGCSRSCMGARIRAMMKRTTMQRRKTEMAVKVGSARIDENGGAHGRQGLRTRRERNCPYRLGIATPRAGECCAVRIRRRPRRSRRRWRRRAETATSATTSTSA